MNDNSSFEPVPGAPNNTTVLFDDTNVVDQALSIALGALTVLAVVVVSLGGLFLNITLVSIMMKKLGMKDRVNEVTLVSVFNGIVFGLIIVGFGLHDWLDRGLNLLPSIWHALVLGGLIVVFLVIFELLVVGLYYCANADWSVKQPAADPVELERLARPMMPGDETGIYTKGATVARDEDSYSEV